MLIQLTGHAHGRRRQGCRDGVVGSAGLPRQGLPTISMAAVSITRLDLHHLIWIRTRLATYKKEHQSEIESMASSFIPIHIRELSRVINY